MISADVGAGAVFLLSVVVVARTSGQWSVGRNPFGVPQICDVHVYLAVLKMLVAYINQYT